VDLGFVLLLAIPVVLLFVLSSRTRRQQRDTAALQAGIQVGQEVMTAAGFYATIVSVDGDVVVLESVPGQLSRWDRRAIVKVLPTPVEDGTTAPPQDGPGGPASPAAS
jgi:preprotein translocase subunit YajC